MNITDEKLLGQLDDFYISAARHDICPTDKLAISLRDIGGTAAFRPSEQDMTVSLADSEDEEAQIHREIYSACGYVCCIVSFLSGHAFDFAARGKPIVPSVHRHAELFPDGVPCAGSVGEMCDIFARGKTNAVLLEHKGAYIVSADPSDAIEIALALEYVAKMEKITALLRGK